MAEPVLQVENLVKRYADVAGVLRGAVIEI